MKATKVDLIRIEALSRLQLVCSQHHQHGIECMEGPEEAKQALKLCNELIGLRQNAIEEPKEAMKKTRKKNIEVAGSGAYIQVYQRPGEPAMADVVFFDGDRQGEKELENYRDAIDKAVEQLRKWNRKAHA